MATADDGTGFPGAARLASDAGLAPRPDRRQPPRRTRTRGGNRQLKPAMFLSAFACMNVGPASRAYCDRQRARGKTHTQALLRPARQRISVLSAMLRDGTFCEARTPRHDHPKQPHTRHHVRNEEH
ncbi:transposase [Streptomyces sp. NRRL F-2664]|uniref:transposase n=1 Tax=Streptomyces sp. NRRL F-2664 TaxID=1463842 RepID=UPI003B63A3B6